MMFYISDERRRDFFIFILALLFLTTPFGIKINNILIIVTLVSWLFVYKLRNLFPGLKGNRILICLILFFLLSVLGLAYSTNLWAGVAQVEKVLSLLIFPVVFSSVGNLKGKESQLLKFSFAGGTFIACLICYGNAVMDAGSLYTYPDFNYYIHPFGRIGYSGYLGIDPSYISLYIVISLLFVFGFIRETSVSVKFFLIVVMAFFLFNLVILASKGPLLALGVSMLLVLFLLRIKAVYSTALILLILSCSYLLLNFNTQIKHRVFDEFELTVEHRLGQLKAAWLIVTDNPLFGVGTGDSDEALVNAYNQLNDQNNLKVEGSTINPNNPHNQYLSILVKFGVFGLLLFCLGNYWLLNKLMLHKEYFDVLVMTVFIICFLFESLLERRAGILPYALCYSLFAITQPEKSRRITPPKID